MIQNTLALKNRYKNISFLFTDLLIIAFVYLIPTLSHLTAIPFYLLDPMRFALISCIIVTNKKNSLVIALSLPVISFLISSHPEILKSVLISLELMINVILFYYLSTRMKNLFLIMLLSITASKIFYYSGKFLLLSFGLFQGDLVSTSLWIQLILLIFISAITAIALRNREESKIR